MKKINESFTCIGCGKNVVQARKTCRNHCPHCFISLHVDGDIPGDRQALCGGKMYPVSYIRQNSQVKIEFMCSQCGKKHINKQADDDELTKIDEYITLYKKNILSC